MALNFFSTWAGSLTSLPHSIPWSPYSVDGASQVAPVVKKKKKRKNLPATAGDSRDAGLIPGWGRLPWRRKWQPTPVFLPGKFHGQSSLAGCSPGVCKEWDMTEMT